MNKIGTLYLDPKHYASEANQTVGAPIVGPNMEVLIANRRESDSALTPAGEKVLEQVRYHFKANYNVKVYIRWSRFAGCSTCPCSPGFNIMVAKEDFFLSRFERRGAQRDARMWSIWGQEDGTLDLRVPTSDYWPIRTPNTLSGLA